MLERIETNKNARKAMFAIQAVVVNTLILRAGFIVQGTMYSLAALQSWRSKSKDEPTHVAPINSACRVAKCLMSGCAGLLLYRGWTMLPQAAALPPIGLGVAALYGYMNAPKVAKTIAGPKPATT